MPIYSYKCDDCETFTYEVFSMSEMKPCIQCPKCGGESPRSLEGQSMNFKMEGSTPKFFKNSENAKKKDEAWLSQEIDNTAQALKNETGASPYSRMSMNMDVLEEQGQCKRVSEKEAKARKDTAAKLTQEVSKAATTEEMKIITREDRTHSK